MIDIKFLRENPDVVKQNIKNKFQDQKLPLVDEVIALDKESRTCKMHGDELRSKRKQLSDQVGNLMREGKKAEAEEIKLEVKAINDELTLNEEKEEKYAEEIRERMMKIPNIMDKSVPIGKDDSENVEVERFGEPKVPDYEIPHHADIIARFNGLDKESAGRTSGVGFYYLIGDIARLHEAMLAYARDYMINNGFTYCIPPFMIRSDGNRISQKTKKRRSNKICIRQYKRNRHSKKSRTIKKVWNSRKHSKCKYRRNSRTKRNKRRTSKRNKKSTNKIKYRQIAQRGRPFLGEIFYKVNVFFYVKSKL